MSKKKKRIPELRFPEFGGAGEWKYENGDELFEPISNKNHNSDLPILAITQELGAVPRELIDYHVSVSEKSVESYKVVEVGDFIISLRSFQGGIEYSSYLGLCSPAYIILRKKRDILNDFYRHYFKSFLFIRNLNRNLEGIRDGKMISYKQFSEILIPNPRKDEQQKIASCLSSLDELIAAHKDKLEALKDHKKGLLQNLFPHPSTGSGSGAVAELVEANVPKVRFPEFDGDGEWVEKKLGKVSKFVSGGTPSKSNPLYWSGRIPWISASSMHDIQIHDSKLKITEQAINAGTRIVEAGTILILVRGSMLFNKVPICITMKAVSFNQDVKALILNEDCTPRFILYQLLAYESLIPIDKTGIGAGKIGLEELKELILYIPRSGEEQQKIASCLSAVDELITAQQEKIEQLQQHKKGLMQGLFPNPSAGSGETLER